MAISGKDTKILWANAAGRCSFADCRKKLCTDHTHEGEHYTLGEMAHIKGKKQNAARYDATQTPSKRDAYDNLILLCSSHHTLIDQQANIEKYSVELLHEIKSAHESFVLSRVEAQKCQTRSDLASLINPLLAENSLVFWNYGPHSQVARKNPTSDAHEMWLLERLSTIVPNNRIIANLLEQHKDLLRIGEHEVVEEFKLHVRGYERWVSGESEYEGVVRFPEKFPDFVKELENAGA